MKGPSKSYIEMLDEALISKNNEPNQKKFFPLRPSSAGKCTKELAYEMMEYYGKASYDKKPQDPASTRLLSLGHSVEWSLLKQMDLIKDFDIQYKQQVVEMFKINDRIIEGSLDACFISDKLKAVIDVKSKGNKWSKAYKSKWEEDDAFLASLSSVIQFAPSAFYIEDLPKFLNEIKDDPFLAANFLQLNLYANTKFLKDRGIDHCALLYYCKNDSHLREIRFKPDASLVEEIKEKFQIADDAARKGKPEDAPRDYALGSIKCAFCPYSQACHGDADSLKAYFNTFPKKEWPKDTNRLRNKKKIEETYKEFRLSSDAYEGKQIAEQELIKMMQAENVKKIRFEDGKIYRIQFYKSPYERLALVEDKL